MFSTGLLAVADTHPGPSSSDATLSISDIARDERLYCVSLEAHAERHTDLAVLDKRIDMLCRSLRSLTASTEAYRSRSHTVSLEASIKDTIKSIGKTIMAWIRRVKDFIMGLFRRNKDRIAKLNTRAKALAKKVNGVTFSDHDSARIAEALSLKQPRKLESFGVMEGKHLVIRDNQVMRFKRLLDECVGAQERDKKISDAILQITKRKLAPPALTEGDPDVPTMDDYLNVIRSKVGKGEMVPGGLVFTKAGIRTATMARNEDAEDNLSMSILMSGLASFGGVPNAFPRLMEFVIAATDDNGTFSSNTEKRREAAYNDLENEARKATDAITKMKGYGDDDTGPVYVAMRKTVKSAMSLAYRATLSLHSAWITALHAMVYITAAYVAGPKKAKTM